MKLNSLLKFEEDNPEVMNFKFKHDNILIWPHIRRKVYQHIIDSKLDLQISHAPMGDFKFSDLIDYNLNTVAFNPFENQGLEFDIVMFSDVRNNIIRKDEKYFNIIHDYFALQFSKNTLIIEKSYRRKYKLPRYFENVKFLDIIDFLVASKIKDVKVEKQDEEEIVKFINFLKMNLKFNINKSMCNNIKNELIILSKKLKFYHLYYKVLFLILNPKIIFLKCASYGDKGYLIKWAKDFGIKVGEFQHGMISRNHSAYNYGDNIFYNLDYKKYLPDYLLTYGDYWGENIKIPVNKISIGNPHFYKKLEKYKNRDQNSLKNKILIVSQGSVTNKLVNLTKNLSYLLKNQDVEIIYRLHPGEIPFHDRYTDLQKLNNVTINDSGDIYDLIYQSNSIVGVYSTTLFEAIGFNKPIFIYEHELSNMHIPMEIGERFKDAEELYEILNNNKVNPTGNVGYYWEKDWKNNYKNFINKIL
ncbi:hypothetical protein U472_03495 [Orenia metallireducens]|uniref:Capsule polysaccharide biosynthesis protein n=1 Tax=Orenia metallireducens TaxID=1413210 RepID=A0A1C0ABA6_9FIRM|nr:CDP-glycerol glycerophosphotransferase family protein [Orenia metallireducens]OCL27628.1 hypothetical protein U472_03495 [Orenia metallireducens]